MHFPHQKGRVASFPARNKGFRSYETLMSKRPYKTFLSEKFWYTMTVVQGFRYRHQETPRRKPCPQRRSLFGFVGKVAIPQTSRSVLISLFQDVPTGSRIVENLTLKPRCSMALEYLSAFGLNLRDKCEYGPYMEHMATDPIP